MITAYLLTLPTGTVRARKLHPLESLAYGIMSMPLLSAAMQAARGDDDAPPQRSRRSEIDRITEVCVAALIEPTGIDLPWLDRMALYGWATCEDIAGAVPDGEWQWTHAALARIVTGQSASLLDSICQRYQLRPSGYLGLDGLNAMDFDFAVGMSASQSERAPDKREVEVEDAWGNVHKVPAGWLSGNEEQGARKINLDYYAKNFDRYKDPETGVLALSMGGMGGDGAVGLFGRFRQ